MTETTTDVATDLVDITDLSLTDLLSIDSPALADCLRRVVEDTDRPEGIVAGFNSAI